MFGMTVDEERVVHTHLCWAMIYLSPVVFLFLIFVLPPNWGKTYRTLLGPTVPAKVGWALMEVPNLTWVFLGILNTPYQDMWPPANILLLLLFTVHYINRALIYPLTLHPTTKPLPLEIVISAFLFTNWNGYLQAQALCALNPYPNTYYIGHPVFTLGLLVFGAGAYINTQSDKILTGLRKQRDKNKKTDGDKRKKPSNNGTTNYVNYVLPYGGMFEYVSAPHYLGEIMEWTGFAMACQSLAGAAFAVFTAANLIPRALAHHQWYQAHFEEYLNERKAVIPFVW